MTEFKDLDEFEVKIKQQLNKNDDENFSTEFAKLKEFLAKFGGIGNRGVQMLTTEFFELITAEESIERKAELFTELVDELKAFLDRKAKMTVTQSEYTRRKQRIRVVTGRLEELRRQIIKLESKELSLDDLGKQQDNVVDTLRSLQSKALKLVAEKAELENKHSYNGKDLNFENLTDHEQLNEILQKSIVGKFKKNREIPTFEDVTGTVVRFSMENQRVLDPESIYKKLCSRLKQHRQQSFHDSLNTYTNDQNLSRGVSKPVEDEQLKEKLDSQNDFKVKIAEIVQMFLEDRHADDEEGESVDEEAADEEEEAGDQEAADDTISLSSDEDDSPGARSDETGDLICSLPIRIPVRQPENDIEITFDGLPSFERRNQLIENALKEFGLVSEESAEKAPEPVGHNEGRSDESSPEVTSSTSDYNEHKNANNEDELKRKFGEEADQSTDLSGKKSKIETDEDEDCILLD